MGAVVLRGTKEKTAGGLTKSDLFKNKRGKIVSKKQSAKAKKIFAQTVGPWMQAVKKARAALKLKGFVAIKKGSPLYIKAKEFFAKWGFRAKCPVHGRSETPAPSVGHSTLVERRRFL